MEATKLLLVFMGVLALGECQPESIQCFQCSTAVEGEEDCTDPFEASMQDKYRKACSAGSTTCLKVVTGATVVRSCNNPVNATCGEPEVENPAGTFNYCCTGNACNAAGQVGRSIALALSTILGLLMCHL